MTQEPNDVPIESIPKSNSLNDSKNNSENRNIEGTLNFVHPAYDPNNAGSACQNDVNSPSDQPHESATNRKDEMFMNPRNPNFMMSQRSGMGGARPNMGMGAPRTVMGSYGSMGGGPMYNPNMMQNYGGFRSRGQMSAFSGMQPYNPHNPMMSGSMHPRQAVHMGNSYAASPQNSAFFGGYDPSGYAGSPGGMPNRMSYNSSGCCQSPYLNVNPYNSPLMYNQNCMNGIPAGGNMAGFNLGMNCNNRFGGPYNRGYAVNRFRGGFRGNGMLFEGNEKVDPGKTVLNAPKEVQGPSDFKKMDIN